MDAKTLRYFMQAYTDRNFAQAAKKIPISPQGLTKAMHALENELDVTLFDNSGGAQDPTLYGDRLYEYATRQAACYQELIEDFARIKRERTGVLRVGVSTGIMGVLPFDLFDRFEEDYPNIHIQKEDTPDYLCEKNLYEDAYDMAFTTFPFDERFETNELFADHHFIWMRKDHPLACNDEVAADDLIEQKVMSVGPEFKGYYALRSLCAESGFELCDHTTVSEMVWLHRLAAQGEGLSLTVRHQVELFDDAEVLARPIPDLPWKFGISYRRGKSLNPTERIFLSYVSRKARALGEDSLLDLDS